MRRKVRWPLLPSGKQELLQRCNAYGVDCSVIAGNSCRWVGRRRADKPQNAYAYAYAKFV